MNNDPTITTGTGKEFDGAPSLRLSLAWWEKELAQKMRRVSTFKVMMVLFAVWAVGIYFGWVAHDETVMVTSIARRAGQKLEPCESYSILPLRVPEADVSKVDFNKLIAFYGLENPPVNDGKSCIVITISGAGDKLDGRFTLKRALDEFEREMASVAVAMMKDNGATYEPLSKEK